MHADVCLWLGPDWTPFTLKAYSEDGKTRPIQTLIGTRNKAAMIEVRNVFESEFPFKAASNYAKGEMAAVSKEMPSANPGELSTAEPSAPSRSISRRTSWRWCRRPTASS